MKRQLTRRRGWRRALQRAGLLLAALTSVVTSLTARELRMQDLLHSDRRLAAVVDRAAEHRLQIVLGLVEPGDDGRLVLRQLGFRADAEYFYPASAIKLFAAVAALDLVARTRLTTGLPIDEHTPLVFHPLFADENERASDPSNLEGGTIQVEHEIRKLLLVSDNEAFNRLLELVGRDDLHRFLQRAGLTSARLVHRLSVRRNAVENQRFPKIDWIGHDFRHTLPQRSATIELPAIPVAGLSVGRGYDRDGRLIEEAMDFSGKNRMSLIDLQRGLAMVVLPGVDAGGPGFDLTPGHRALLLEAMRQYPGESQNPIYSREQYPDAWVKFFLPGLERVLAKERLAIYNKIGQAYGFTTENAYVVDRQTGRSFFLTATLYTNSNGILNDDAYDYETVAEPFLENLAETVARTLWAVP